MRKIIIDTDPGIDDALALAIALMIMFIYRLSDKQLAQYREEIAQRDGAKS